MAYKLDSCQANTMVNTRAYVVTSVVSITGQ